MKKLGALILGAILTIGVGVGISVSPKTDVAEAASTYPATLETGTTQSYASKVVVGSETFTAVKCGSSKAAGDMTVTVGVGATKLSFYAAAWSGVSDSTITISSTTGVTFDPSEFTLISDSGISGGSNTYTLSTSDASKYYYETTLTNVTAQSTFKITGAKRFVVWNATYTSDVAPEEPTEPEYKEVTIGEALKEEDDTKVSVRGIVSEIITAYSSLHDNISVNITDGTDTLYVYRLTGEVKVGDDITVTGKMDTYNEARQIAQGATAVIHSSGNEVPGGIPEAKEVTIGEALAEKDGTLIIVRGIVSNIGQAYNETYNNMSVDITDGKDTLYIFRLAAKVEVGDDITVTGKMATYKGVRQIAEGATAVIHSSGNDVPAEEPEQPEQPTTGTSIKLVVANYAAANGLENGVQYPTLKINNFLKITATGGANTGKYYTNGQNWRIYQSENPQVTIEAVEGIVITAAKITYLSDKGGKLNEAASDELITVNAASVTYTVGNTGEATNGQAKITAVEVIVNITAQHATAAIKNLAGGWNNNVGTANCATNYAAAKEIVLAMTAGELNTFKTSTDTEIASARTTYENWCHFNGDNSPYEGAIVDASNIALTMNNNNIVTIVIILGAVLALAATLMLISKKRKLAK